MRRKRNVMKIISAWLLVLFSMGLIFYLSHQPATVSGSLSLGLVDIVIHVLGELLPFIRLNKTLFFQFISISAALVIVFIIILFFIALVRRKFKIFAVLFVFLFSLVFIFYLFYEPGMSVRALGSDLFDFLLRTVDLFVPLEELNRVVFHQLIRKSAHFIAYFFLGLFAMNAVRRSGSGHIKAIILTLLICVVYAAFDEAHQLFIPGRSGEVKDVLIDGAGASVGIGVYLLMSMVADVLRR